MIHKREELCTRHFNIRNRNNIVFDNKQTRYIRKSERIQLREREAQIMRIQAEQRAEQQAPRCWF